jgi:hypothetical protein
MFVVALVLNFIAAYYGSTSALSFSTIFIVFLIWALSTSSGTDTSLFVSILSQSLLFASSLSSV